MLEKLKKRVTHASKETVKEEARKHAPEIFAICAVLMLGYLCIKVNGKPVNVTINVNGAPPVVIS